jgi:hypothetical protein
MANPEEMIDSLGSTRSLARAGMLEGTAASGSGFARDAASTAGLGIMLVGAGGAAVFGAASLQRAMAMLPVGGVLTYITPFTTPRYHVLRSRQAVVFTLPNKARAALAGDYVPHG